MPRSHLVLAFVAGPVTRAKRAEAAKVAGAAKFTDKQPAFGDFVPAQYVT
ncbi:MAG: hypothetical protein Q7T25_02865 [Sideroxyarcus sp.]|nr:hypothetical protein [Sideroxyarcus sp.]